MVTYDTPKTQTKWQCSLAGQVGSLWDDAETQDMTGSIDTIVFVVTNGFLENPIWLYATYRLWRVNALTSHPMSTGYLTIIGRRLLLTWVIPNPRATTGSSTSKRCRWESDGWKTNPPQRKCVQLPSFQPDLTLCLICPSCFHIATQYQALGKMKMIDKWIVTWTFTWEPLYQQHL